MLEGLAVWALFIYLLRLVGMPWNKATKSFTYLGGLGWLMFVWVGLINFTPMDLSGENLTRLGHARENVVKCRKRCFWPFSPKIFIRLF